MTETPKIVWLDPEAREFFYQLGPDDETSDLAQYVRADLYYAAVARAELAEASDAESLEMYRRARDRAEAAKAEVERLREALDRIGGMEPHWARQTPNEYHMQEIAGAALGEGGE